MTNFIRSTLLVLLVILAFELRLIRGEDPYLRPWDERYHALVAKNLLDDPLRPLLYKSPLLEYDYHDWTANHVWLHKQPFPLWLIALSFRTFGISELALRLPSILLSSLAVVLTFLIARRIFGESVALLAAFLHAIDGANIQLATGVLRTDHVDSIFISLIELSVFLAFRVAERKSLLNHLLLGISLGCALLTKWIIALVVFPVWLALLWRRVTVREILTSFAIVGLVAGVVAIPWQVYSHISFPHEAVWESDYNFRHIFEPLEGHQGNFFYHFNNLWKYYSVGVLVSLAVFVAVFLRRKPSSGEIALCVWFVVPYVAFSLMATKMPAYVMIASPALFMMVAFAWFRIKDFLWSRSPLIAACLIAVLLLLVVRETSQSLRQPADYPLGTSQARKFRLFEKAFPGDKVVMFNVRAPIEAMFYTSKVAYASLPTEIQVAELKERGYRVAVVDNQALPKFLLDDPEVYKLAF